MNETVVPETVMLPPSALLVMKNIRFGLKKFRVQALADSIKEFGRVHTNLKVEPLAEAGPNGEAYAIREGHYRKAAVELLNKDGAGLELPCTIEEPLEGAERLKYQISENLDRENLSPMDMAIAIKGLLDTGMSKVDVRSQFQRPGGRKGLAMQPLSNAMLNIYLSFLEFPKATQALIHDGILGVADAYKLTKKPRDQWQAIVDAAKAQIEADAAAEDKLEESYLETERKSAEAEAKSKELAEALTVATKTVDEKGQEAKAKLDAAAKAYAASKAVSTKDKEAKAKAEEAFKAAEAEAKAAEKAVADAIKEADKLKAKAEKNAQLAKERADKLATARKEAAAKPKKLDTEAAAQKLAGGPVALNATEMRKVIADLALPGSFPKVSKIAAAIAKCFSGETTDSQLLSELGWLTGERKDRPKHVK